MSKQRKKSLYYREKNWRGRPERVAYIYANKDYYQNKRAGYNLPHNVYKKVKSTIECYDYYMGVYNFIGNMSETFISEKRSDDKIRAQQYIDAIDNALERYVPEEYQKAVFEVTARNVKHGDVIDKYGISESTLKVYKQAFVYGVAETLGEVIY